LICILILLVMYDIQLYGPNRRHEQLSKLAMELQSQKRIEKGLDHKIVEIAMTNQDPESLYSMLLSSPSHPILKKSIVEKVLANKSETSSKLLAEISKGNLDFFDKLFVFSYLPISKTDSIEAAKDMKAFINLLELGEYAGYEFDSSLLINPNNRLSILHWSESQNKPCRDVALLLKKKLS